MGQGTAYTTLARDFGKQTEHWNGMDFSANARLQNGLMLQGGVSTGRTTTDNCDVIANSRAPCSDGVVLAGPRSEPARVPRPGGVPDAGRSSLRPTSLPRVDVNVAATVQSTPGPVVTANRIYTSAEIAPSLGRPLSGGAATATINLLVPGDIYSDRVNQVDLRVGKIFRFGARRASVNLDIYNVLNANPVMQENAGLRGVADTAAHHGRSPVQDQRAVRFLVIWSPVSSLRSPVVA